MVKLDTLWTAKETIYSLENVVIAKATYAGDGKYEVTFPAKVAIALEDECYKMFSNLESAEYFILYAACEYKAMEERSVRIVNSNYDDEGKFIGTPPNENGWTP